MPESGFLVVADISGYTRFLTGSELDHAQGVLEDLLSVILERLKSPLQLSNIQGDAILAYSRDDDVWSSGHVVDSVDALYFGFRDRLKSIVDNTTCPCRACVNAKKLDLKFVVHHGEFVMQNVAGRQELTGSDVILLHRLLKNDIPQQTGVASYALFTSAAADALGLAELKDGAHRYAVELAEFGRIEGIVVDHGARWQAYHKTNEIVVPDGDLWFEPVTGTLPYNIESVWEAYCNPAVKSRWNTIFDGFTRTIGDPQRVSIGAVDHCAHGKQTLIMRYIDVRPLRHVTLECALPMNGWARWSVLVSTEGSATRVTFRVGKAQGPNVLVTALLGAATRFQKKKVRNDFITQLELLDAFLADEDRHRVGALMAAVSPSVSEIKKTARELVAGGTED